MNEDFAIGTDSYYRSDTDFNDLYPAGIQTMARRHWTPLHIAKLATAFLAGKGKKVLDIGSGTGKFCLTGAYYAPNTQFYGVEQRKYLVDHALDVQKILGVKNVSFIHANLTQLNLQEFDHFYFFNSFYENIDDLDRIDESIGYSEALYEGYVKFLHEGLEQMPTGTRIATYYSLEDEIPSDYKLVESRSTGDLKFWVKR